MFINCNGKLLNLDEPKIMGILNYTRDSFYDGGKNTSIDFAISNIAKMLEEGANIIDVGGQSTRPNASFINANDEWKNISELISELKIQFPKTIFSIDTFWAEVAEKAIVNGFSLVNDISGGNIDDKMFETVANLQVPYVLTHSKGTPQSMNNETNYTDLIYEVNLFFSEKIQNFLSLKMNDIILDVGFGFAKTLEQNYELLQHLDSIQTIQNKALLVGISRKSMIYNALNTNAQNALNGTTALNMIALQKGAKILRVHDVKEAKECIKLMYQFNNVSI